MTAIPLLRAKQPHINRRDFIPFEGAEHSIAAPKIEFELPGDRGLVEHVENVNQQLRNVVAAILPDED